MAYQLGIVLSGGGARGFAHIGVLKALTERGLAADCLSGTSSGALVGALYAAGYSADEMLEFFRAKNPFKLSKLSVGKPGIIDTAKVRADYLEYFPDDSFAALGKRLFVTATDIVNGKAVTFESGPLISPLLASASIPMVFTPTEIGDRWYIDGGILNNFPVEPLAGLCDVIVGVYATSFKVLRREDMTSTLAVLQRALDVAIYSNSKARFHACNVLITPGGLEPYGTFDTKHFSEICEAGYRAAGDRIEAIEQALAAVG